MSYRDLIEHPEKAVEFGPNGFVLTASAWQDIAREAWVKTAQAVRPIGQEFERRYEATEMDLANRLIARIKEWCN